MFERLNPQRGILVFILAICPILHAQNLPASFQIEGKAQVTHNINILLRHAHDYDITPSHFAVFGRSAEEAYWDEDLYLFSLDGKMLWKKNFDRILGVSLGDRSQKVIVKHSYNGIVAINSCYDYSGYLLWTNTLPSPGITQSSDGQYGIVEHMGEGDSMGYFKIFRLDTGSEIPTPFKNDYTDFQARFIDSRRVAIVFNFATLERSEVALKRSKEYKSKSASNIRQGVPKIWNIQEYPAEFVIYEIPTQNVLRREILSNKSGAPLRLPPNAVGCIAVLDNEIALGLRDVDTHTYFLVLFNRDGDSIWESNLGEDRILNIQKIYGSSYLLVTQAKKKIALLHRNTGQQIWNQQLTLKGSDLVRRANLDNNRLHLLTSDYWNTQSLSYELNALTGDEIGHTLFPDKAVPIVSDSITVLLDQVSRSIRFYNSK